MLTAVLPLLLLCVQDPLDALTRVRPARSRRATANATDPNSNRDNRQVKPGETCTLAELTGPGVIRHLWLTFAEARPGWLARYWDGSKEVEVREHSLGDLELEPGPHTLGARCTGKNAASTGFKLGIDSVRLRARWDRKRKAPGK